MESWRRVHRNSGSLSTKETLGIGAAEAADVVTKSAPPNYDRNEDSPAAASSFLGTGEESFLSSSKRAGEIVRKSQPARALISPVCDKVRI